MDQNIPEQSPQTPMPPASGGNKWRTPIIVVGVIIIIVIGYTAFHRWQQTRALKGMLNDLGINDQAAEMLGDTMANYANQMAEEIAKQEAEAKKTPQDKYNEAAVIDIGDNGKKDLADGVTPVITAVFGDTKITGYTSGYMGMNSGSGVMQFMTPDTLDASKANELSKKLQEAGYQVTNLVIDQQSATLTAEKNNVDYTFSFNTGDQSVTLIVLNKQQE